MHSNTNNFSNAQQALEIHQNLATEYTSNSQPTKLTKKNLGDFYEDDIEEGQPESNE